jgi:hypothetical protein
MKPILLAVTEDEETLVDISMSYFGGNKASIMDHTNCNSTIDI